MRNTLRLSFTVASLALSLACGDKPSEPAPAPAAPEAPAAPAAAPAAPSGLPEVPPVPENAKVSFVEPADAAKIEGPLVDGKVKVAIKMGAENITVKPAGAPEAGTGHHHLLIDTEPTNKGDVVAADEKHIHFGKAQTETEIALAPGEHTLRLQFADGLHRSYGPQLAAQITVNVAEAKAAEEKPAAEEPAKKGTKTKASKTKP